VKRFKTRPKNLAYLAYRLISPAIDPLVMINGIKNYPRFIKELLKYSDLKDAEKIEFKNIYPILSDSLSSTPFDNHYFYQDIWAAKKIFRSKIKVHCDVGSNIEFVGFLSTFTRVEFVDIRPLKVRLKNFNSIKGTVLNLPYESGSVRSLSCLHVAEHIGLGRYGDKLDPNGTMKACKELERVLAKNGNLYFSLPIGKPRLCFNAHRIYSPKQILGYFDKLTLAEFSVVDDNAKFIEKTNLKLFEKSNYACGLFWFTKK